MRTTFKKIISLCLVAFLLVPLIGALPIAAEEQASTSTVRTGATFAVNETYTVKKALDKTPLTFEASISLPTTYSGRPGVIFGNYANGNTPALSFELESEKTIRLYGSTGNGSFNIKFTYDVRSDDGPVHIAVTLDPEAKTAKLYINGTLMKDLTKTNNSEVVSWSKVLPSNRFMVGGDLRTQTTNQQYFKGQIYSVAVYSDTRTDEEIAASYANGVSSNDENLLVAYDMTKENIKDRIQDLSKNDNDLVYSSPTYDQTELAKGLTFTQDNTYKMSSAIPAITAPATFEAELFLSTGNVGRGGTILGNYAQGRFTMNFEVYEGGQPRIYFEGSGAPSYSIVFDKVDIRGSWVHLAITVDYNTGTFTCYVDGEPKQQIVISDFVARLSDFYSTPLYLGRDTRNSAYFKGAIKSLAMYSDIRTESEIAADMARVDIEDEALVAAYYFTEETGRKDISDNANHIYYDGEPVITPPSGGDNEGEGGESGDNGAADGTIITELDGLTFASNDYAIIQKQLTNNAPYTFEATILLPKNYTSRAGVIVGNHNSNNYKFISFEVHENGNPRLCFTSPTNNNFHQDYIFKDVNVATGEPVHLAITVDPATGTARCYVNGVIASQPKSGSPITFDEGYLGNYYLVVGNDARDGGAQYFKGVIGNVALFSDVRTDAEIKADYESLDLNSEGLILSYDLSDATKGEDIADLSGNGYNIKFNTRGFTECSSWFTDKEEPSDYLYSFAFIGDTQIIAQNHSSDFAKIYDWILANQSLKKIQHVFGLGDITNNNSSNEWTVAQNNILRLNGVIPYSVVRGNHDGKTQFNNLFAKNEEYASQFLGFYAEGDATNSYRTLEVEGVKYLLITLDYGANDDILAWAADKIEKYSDHKVIITTHAYLYRDGTTLDSKDVCPPTNSSSSNNNGDHMWDELISQYENIFLVVSGHDPSAQVVVTQTEGVHGNIVTQILTDHQGVDTGTPTGMVTMLYFKNDGSIEVETYSTIQECYYRESNQFIIKESEHRYGEATSCVYNNGYLANGTYTAICSICEKAGEFDVAPIISVSGYSVNRDFTAICVGYSINYEVLSFYESISGEQLTLGVVACASQALVNADNKPINADGTSAETIAGRVVNAVLSREYTNVSVMISSDDWTGLESVELLLCMYIIDSEGVQYACDDSTSAASANAITYAQITARAVEDMPKKEGEDE